MNIMIVLWRLQHDIAFCDKKTVSGSWHLSDWQILLITQCAPCSVWRGLALVAKEVSGRLKHQWEEVLKPLQILCLGVRRNGSNWRTWPWQSAMSSATVLQLAQRWRAICWAMEGVFPGLAWLVRVGNGARLVACSHTSHFSGLIRLH